MKSLVLRVSMCFCAALAALMGCKSGTPPLIFGQAHVVGISVDTGTSGQPADFTLGYKSYDLAIVPVIAPAGTQINSFSSNNAVDALSVLGQFNVNSGSSGGGTAALGEFFSTGTAAQVLALGFATNLCNSTNQTGNTNPNSQSSSSSSSESSSSESSSSGSDKLVRNVDCGNVFSTIATRAIAGTAASASSSASPRSSANVSSSSASSASGGASLGSTPSTPLITTPRE